MAVLEVIKKKQNQTTPKQNDKGTKDKSSCTTLHEGKKKTKVLPPTQLTFTDQKSF